MAFPFAPWEYPYWRDNLLEHDSVVCDGYLLQLTQNPNSSRTSPLHNTNWLFFRQLDSHDKANFAVTGYLRPRVGTHIGTFKDLSPSELQSIFRQALIEGAFIRVFFLNENGDQLEPQATPHSLLVVNATGIAKWSRLYVFPQTEPFFCYGESTPFRSLDTPDPVSFLSTPSHEIWSQIQEQLQQPDSDCAWARRTLYWSDEEWKNLVYKWKKGTHTELQQVLTTALMSQTRLWERGNSYQWYIDLNHVSASWHRGRLIQRDGSHSRRYLRHGAPAPDFMRDVLHRVAPYFEPALDEELLRTRLWAEHWWMEFMSSEGIPGHLEWPLSVECINPTAHERFEAARFWQEWQLVHPPMN